MKIYRYMTDGTRLIVESYQKKLAEQERTNVTDLVPAKLDALLAMLKSMDQRLVCLETKIDELSEAHGKNKRKK